MTHQGVVLFLLGSKNSVLPYNQRRLLTISTGKFIFYKVPMKQMGRAQIEKSCFYAKKDDILFRR